MTASLAVLAGSALGGLARHWVGVLSLQLFGPRLPWGTLAINVIGSFVIGWFGSLTAPGGSWEVPFEARLFVMVGVCGGFTTFSSFSLQTLELLQREEYGWALAYVAGSVLLCLLAVAAGFAAGR